MDLLNNVEKLISFEDDPIEFLVMILNKTVCLIQLKRFSSVLIETNKGLKKLNLLTKNTINKKMKSIYEDNKEKIK